MMIIVARVKDHQVIASHVNQATISMEKNVVLVIQIAKNVKEQETFASNVMMENILTIEVFVKNALLTVRIAQVQKQVIAYNAWMDFHSEIMNV